MHDLHIGDTLHADPETWGRRAIFEPGEHRWHGLTVRPMSERNAIQALHQRNVYGFYSVKRRVIWRRGREVVVQSSYLPGYVFARFPGAAIQHRVLADIPWITGAVTVQSGAWAILNPEDLRRLYDMRALDNAQERERRRLARRRKRIEPGDRVRILSGLWGEGQETEVLELRDGKAVVRIHMFGADMTAEADVARLTKIG